MPHVPIRLDVDLLQPLQQRGAEVERGVRRGDSHIVTVQRTDRDHGKIRYAQPSREVMHLLAD